MSSSKGGKIDASGEFIKSVRLVVDSDADAGLGTALDPVRVDPTGTTVQPVSGTVTVGSITGTLDTNLKNVGGTTTDTNSGLKSAGTLRVVLATDQPQLTNVLKVDGSGATQPVSGTVTARILGNGGAAIDSTIGAATAPANQVVTGSVYNTAAPAPTNGQALARQSDAAGNIRVNIFGNVGSFTSQVVTATAGSDASITVPAGKKWILKSAEATLTTNATAANRQMILATLDSSSNILAAGVASFTQAASAAIGYTFAPSVPNMASPVALNATQGFPEVFLGPGFVVRTFVGSKQTGDVVKLALNVMEISD